MSRDKHISDAYRRAQLLRGRPVADPPAETTAPDDATLARARALSEKIKADKAQLNGISAAEKQELVARYNERAAATEDPVLKRALELAAGIHARRPAASSDDDSPVMEHTRLRGFDRER